MLSIQITEIKNFMAHLLSRETFDQFYLVEASVKMNISYHLDGHLNHDFLTPIPQKNQTGTTVCGEKPDPLSSTSSKANAFPSDAKSSSACPKAPSPF